MRKLLYISPLSEENFLSSGGVLCSSGDGLFDVSFGGEGAPGSAIRPEDIINGGTY